MFYGKLAGTTIPKILSVSLLTTKEHPYKVKKKISKAFFSQLMKKSIFDFSVIMKKLPCRFFFYFVRMFFGS